MRSDERVINRMPVTLVTCQNAVRTYARSRFVAAR